MKRRAPIAVVLLVLLAVASTAQAAQRYASPTGKGVACEKEAPCPLSTAVNSATKGDEVIVGTGNYPLLVPLSLKLAVTDVSIHGDFAAPMPTISLSSVSPTLEINSAGSSLSWVSVTNVGNFGAGVACSTGGRVDRVRVTTTGSDSAALQLNRGCAVRDSLLIATGSDSAAISGFSTEDGYTGTVRNVTAIATGAKSSGVISGFTEVINDGSYTLSISNSIVSGVEQDIRADDGIFGPGNVVIDHSNFDSEFAQGDAEIKEGVANQTAAALFVDAAGGDYREAVGSPTIDAGVAGDLGALDLDGNARTVGAAPDIGAYEFVPLTPPPPAPGQIQSLTVAPKSFRSVNAGEAIVSAVKGKVKTAIGAGVTYSLSAAGTVDFTIEKLVTGRKAGKKCVKKTKTNKGRKRCVLRRPVKGSFSHSGAAGANSFRFSGRIAGRGLKPGRHELIGRTGETIVRAAFTIVK